MAQSSDQETPQYHVNIQAGPFSTINTMSGKLSTIVPFFSLKGKGRTDLSLSIAHRSHPTSYTSSGSKHQVAKDWRQSNYEYIRGGYFTNRYDAQTGWENKDSYILSGMLDRGGQWAKDVKYPANQGDKTGTRVRLPDTLDLLKKESGQDFFVTEKGTGTVRRYKDIYPYFSLLDEIRDVFGNVVDLQYAPNDGPMTLVKDATNQRSISFAYRADTTYFGMSSASLNYPDATGTVKSRTWRFNIDPANGRLSSITWPTNRPLSEGGYPRSVFFYYTSAGNIQQIVDLNSQVWWYEYDTAGRVTKVRRAGSSGTVLISIQYDDANDGGLTQVTNALGNTTDYRYDTSSNPYPVVYHPLISVTDPLVSNPLLVDSTNPSGNESARHVESTEFFLNSGRIKKKTDRRGIVTTYQWDGQDAEWPNGDYHADGNLTKKTVTNPTSGTSYITSYTYINRYQVNSITTSYQASATVTPILTGYTTNEFNDSTGTLQTASNLWNGSMVAVRTENQYDPSGSGRLWKTRKGSDAFTTYDAFDPYTDQPTTITSPSGGKTYVEYDSLGRKTSDNVPDATGSGRFTLYSYDEWDHLTRTIYPDQTASSITYRYDDLPSSKTDRNGNTTSYRYDILGNLTNETKDVSAASAGIPARTLSTDYNRDNLGNLKAVNVSAYNAFGGPPVKTITYDYDELNRRTQTTMADGRVEKTRYDENGNAVQSVDTSSIRSTYDMLNRLVSNRFNNGRNLTTSHVITAGGSTKTTLLYDTTVPNSNGFSKYSIDQYNLAGQLISSQSGENNSAPAVTYEYDDAGRRHSMSVGTQRWEYQYTDDSGILDGQLHKITQAVGAGTVATYVYNPDGTLKTRMSPGAGLKTEYTYDVDSRLTGLDHYSTVGGAYVLNQSVSHVLDPEGQTTLYRDRMNGGTRYQVQYTYDRMNRLVNEQALEETTGDTYASGYQYDEANNRTSVVRADRSGVSTTRPYTYAANDKFLSGDGYSVNQYDWTGRPTSLTYPDSTTSELRYDYDGQLVSIGARGPSAPYVWFEYDGLGRRIRQNETKFFFDGTTAIAETDSASVWTYRVPGVGYVKNGVQFYERENAQGSTVSTTDAAGAVVSRAFYDAYGNESMVQQGPRSRYGYAGNHGYAADGVSGMLLAGARFYVPAIGRFLTPDPSGHAGGLNLYAYCDDNPVAKIDSTGKGPELVILSASGAIVMPRYASREMAAIAGIQRIMLQSNRLKRTDGHYGAEFAGLVFQYGDGSWSYTPAVTLKEPSGSASQSMLAIPFLPRGIKVDTDYHTHPHPDAGDYGDHFASDGDKSRLREWQLNHKFPGGIFLSYSYVGDGSDLARISWIAFGGDHDISRLNGVYWNSFGKGPLGRPTPLP